MWMLKLFANQNPPHQRTGNPPNHQPLKLSNLVDKKNKPLRQNHNNSSTHTIHTTPLQQFGRKPRVKQVVEKLEIGEKKLVARDLEISGKGT